MGKPSIFQVYDASAGSGKTFTLVKEYLKLILENPNSKSFQTILAITFTNKAAGEMKERVLKFLLSFALMNEETTGDEMLMQLMKETSLSLEMVQRRSLECLRQILRNYSSFHINTIDSFTNRLIKSFAFDLNMSMDFEVELDTDSIFNETVDSVISDIGIEKELTKVLIDFAKQKTLQDKSWDISRELLAMSKLLLNENHVKAFETISKKELTDFLNLEKGLLESRSRLKKNLFNLGEQGMGLIADQGLNHNDFLSSQLPNFFKKMCDDPEKLTYDTGKGLQKNIEERRFYAKSKSQAIKDSIESIADELIRLYLASKVFYEKMMLADLLAKNLIPMAISHTISKKLEELKEQNNLRLNAEFNKLISDHLTQEPAPFIYEKLGERFKHFFIDEMQDTSIMQWENLIPLIDNALSTENTSLLLVGDAKQAIYRWRGGRAEQFIRLSSENHLEGSNPFQTSKLVKHLDTNYRSFSEIIEFNNQFFTHISGYFGNREYRDLYLNGCHQKTNSNQGGYVQIEFLEEIKGAALKEEIYPERVYRTLKELLLSFDPAEICILVRKRKEGISIAKFLTDKGIEIVSSETLLLKNNPKVDFIIQLLSFINESKNTDAKFELLDFLYHHLHVESEKHDFLQHMVRLTPFELFKELSEYGVEYDPDGLHDYAFVEGVEEIVRAFKLNEEPDAFIHFFLDVVYEFKQRKSQRKIDFLEYWEEKKDQFSIVNSSENQAVRIMTIHKSKGLEFPVVIFPYDMELYRELSPKAWYGELNPEKYNGFKSLLVDSTSAIKKTGVSGREIFDRQRMERQLDSYNLLYVCLTRAVEQLYIITENKTEREEPTLSSHLLKRFLLQIGKWETGQEVYQFGTVQRVSKRSKSKIMTQSQKSYKSQSRRDKNIHVLSSSHLIWDESRLQAISYGNLIHEMMAEINAVSDLEPTLLKYLESGVLKIGQEKSLYNILIKIVTHPDLKNYFSEGLTVFTEREFLTDDRQVLKPDRIVLHNDAATIIDYKTGHPENKHKGQIRNYALALQKLNFIIHEKLLVYIDTDQEYINVISV